MDGFFSLLKWDSLALLLAESRMAHDGLYQMQQRKWNSPTAQNLIKAALKWVVFWMNTSCKYFLHYVLLCNWLSKWDMSQQQKYVAINFKCCHSSSAVSGMAEDTVHTNGWVLKQANVLEKLPFSRVKIFICSAILFNIKLNTSLQGQAESQEDLFSFYSSSLLRLFLVLIYIPYWL